MIFVVEVTVEVVEATEEGVVGLARSVAAAVATIAAIRVVEGVASALGLAKTEPCGGGASGLSPGPTE